MFFIEPDNAGRLTDPTPLYDDAGNLMGGRSGHDSYGVEAIGDDDAVPLTLPEHAVIATVIGIVVAGLLMACG